MKKPDKAVLILSLITLNFLCAGAAFAQKNRIWGTYYGGATDRGGYVYQKQTRKQIVATDASGNVYLTGLTDDPDSIASGGGFQNSYSGNGDAFLVKFDANGNRLWATYYGGTGGEVLSCVCTDVAGNVYLAGTTFSSSGIASGGFQNAYDPGAGEEPQPDAFLVKFDANGNRLWATYYGGAGWEEGTAIYADANGNVYMAGYTFSPSGIASGGFQNTLSANGLSFNNFLVKFNASGNRLWATYYGPASVHDITTDVDGNVYMTGETNSEMNITTPGAFQTKINIFKFLVPGFVDSIKSIDEAFLVKFDADGNRLWCTYYGGMGWDAGYALATDAKGNVYMAGMTTSTADIASGGFQNSYGGTGGTGWGVGDAFLVKFDADGNRLWATYYGGSDAEFARSLASDATGNVYMAGMTKSTTNIASNGFQNTFKPLYDDFLVEFDSSGNRLCATYYSQSNFEGSSVAIDNTANVYLAGHSTTGSGVPSGGFRNNSTEWGDLYLVKFTSCSDTTLNATVASTDTKCNGACTGTAIGTPINGKGPYTYLWNTDPVQTNDTATGLCEGTYTLTITDAAHSTALALAFIHHPEITIKDDPIYASCDKNNGSSEAYPQGGTSPYTYLWSDGQTTKIATALAAGTYTVTVTDSEACTQTQATRTIFSTPNPLTFTDSSTQAGCSINNGTATAFPENGFSPYSYLWNNGQTTPMATALGAGTYTLTVTDARGCAKTDTVSVKSTINPVKLNVSSTQTGCVLNNGTATAIPENGALPYSYLWNNGQTTPMATALGAGTYTLTVTDAKGCAKTDTITITQTSAPDATASPSEITITSGQKIQLSATGGGTYQWSPATALSNVNAEQTTAAPLQTTTYCALVTDINNCTDTACINVTVLPPCEEIFTPSAFSPNNDGTNDVLYVKARCAQQLEFKIFDRWGNKVFESANVTDGWDGTYKGKALDQAVFVYYMEAVLLSGELINRKGNINLIR